MKAIKMYNILGYIVYRTVLDYYSGDPDEDAYGKNICARWRFGDEIFMLNFVF